MSTYVYAYRGDVFAIPVPVDSRAEAIAFVRGFAYGKAEINPDCIGLDNAEARPWCELQFSEPRLQNILKTLVGEETSVNDLVVLLANVYNIILEGDLPRMRVDWNTGTTPDGTPWTLPITEYVFVWEGECVIVREVESWRGNLNDGWSVYDTYLT